MALGDDTLFLAELGLIFLMFMVGLEFSLTTLLAARTDVLLAGSLQVGGTLATIAAVLWWLGLDPRIAILLGGAVAMSSTAVAMKQLAEQGEISSQHGRFALGILLFQDIATIPLLVAIDSWSRRTSVDPFDLVGRLGLAAIGLIAVSIVARPLVRTVLAGASKSRSNDLFLLAALFVALGAAYLAHLAGLALPIGAFIAGMVIGGSDFQHRVEDDLRPFRDVLVGLFFVTVGMQIDLRLIVVFPDAILAWCAVFLFGKALTTFVVGLMLRRSAAIALRVAVILAHGGEFGLLLLALAMNSGLLPSEIGQPVLIALALTMGLAPLLIQRSAFIEHLVGNRRSAWPQPRLRFAQHARRSIDMLCCVDADVSAASLRPRLRRRRYRTSPLSPISRGSKKPNDTATLSCTAMPRIAGFCPPRASQGPGWSS